MIKNKDNKLLIEISKGMIGIMRGVWVQRLDKIYKDIKSKDSNNHCQLLMFSLYSHWERIVQNFKVNIREAVQILGLWHRKRDLVIKSMEIKLLNLRLIIWMM